MNQLAKIEAGKASLALWPITPGEAAYALWHADIILRSTPHHPEVSYLRKARQEAFEDAVRDMRRALDNA